jgi:hypothetical protein
MVFIGASLRISAFSALMIVSTQRKQSYTEGRRV